MRDTRSPPRVNIHAPRVKYKPRIQFPQQSENSCSQHTTNSLIHPISIASQEYIHLVNETGEKNAENFIFQWTRMILARNMSCVRQKKTQWKSRSYVPHNKKITYGIVVCNIKAEKSETHLAWLTIGWNILDFMGKISTLTETVTTTNIFFNSVISPPGAWREATKIYFFI